MNPLCCVFFLVHHKFDSVTNDLNYNNSQYSNYVDICCLSRPHPMSCPVLPRTAHAHATTVRGLMSCHALTLA